MIDAVGLPWMGVLVGVLQMVDDRNVIADYSILNSTFTAQHLYT